MDRSPAFASDTRNLSRTLRTRFRFGFEPEALNLAAHINSPVHYAKGTPSPGPFGHRAPTACKCLVSGAVSLPLPGFFSFFAHATHPLSVVEEYLALEGGPSSFKPGFSCLALLGRTIGSLQPFAYGAITRCGGTFQDLRLGCRFLTSAPDCNPRTRIPQHQLQNACRLAGSWFGQSFPFARRY